jgi:hypothetical protein
MKKSMSRPKGRRMAALGTAISAGTFSLPLGAAAQSFALPLECPAGGCLIQNYVDRDPSSGVSDFRCGAASYDGHKGTDFRVLSVAAAEKGVAVRAAADGVVKATRDGVPDRIAATPADREGVAGRECGNGVVLDHGGGLETQYCHLKEGSIRVRSGARVLAGAELGLVGYSGDAAFAHVHFEARRDGAPFDPFGAGCGGGAGKPAWSKAAAAAMPAKAETLLEAGFAAGPVAHHALETAAPPAPDAAGEALVFYARFMNLKEGDIVRLRLIGPAGLAVENAGKPLDRSKASYSAFTGKRRTGARWPAGAYRGRAEIVRNGTVVIEAERTLELR